MYVNIATFVLCLFSKELPESQDNVDGGAEIKGSDEIVAKDDSLKKLG